MLRVVWTLEEWASAIVDLPVDARLPVRTVLVPNERVAHALRCTLIAQHAPSALIGTRFVSLFALARECLLDAGELPLVCDPDLGPQLVRQACEVTAFERFRREDLLGLPGWDEAFSRTLADLDAAQVAPESLLASDDAQVRDVGRVQAALRASGGFGTVGGLLQRAAAVCDGASHGALLALVNGFESPAEVSLLRRLPNVTWLLWGVRPVRREHQLRVGSLLGDVFANALATPRREPPRGNTLLQLKAALFEAAPASAGPDDDSVRVATYAGVHEEIEAAVGWVTEQLIERAVPADQIALLTPSAEPYGSLLRARLSALPWSTEAHERPTSFIERGQPLAERADGARLLLAIRALASGLAREPLAALLPVLRATDPERNVRGASRAWELLNTVASVGGSRSQLNAGRVWPESFRRAIAQLQAAAAEGGEVRERDRQAQLAQDLTALLPAIDALDEVLAAVVAVAPLPKLWKHFARLVEQLRLQPVVPPALVLLEGAVLEASRDEALAPRGEIALDWLDAALCHTHARGGRFGMPAVYIGTLAGARGLSFRALRILGLVEGAVPSSTREDPVLPDAARVALSPFLPTASLRAHRQLAQFDSAVRAAREQLVLTAPRVSLEGSTRQPAAVLLDVLRALAPAGPERRLERQLEQAANAGRSLERRLRARLPISASAALERVARRDLSDVRAEPNPALGLEALRVLRDRREPTAQDGLLPGLIPAERLAGLSAERPISASRLATLLSCPHRYLLDQVLYFREADGPLPAHQLDPMRFGTWLHAIAEEYWSTHGPQIGKGKPADRLEQRASLRELAMARFDALAARYPFANEQVQQAQRKALCDQLDKLLQLDWDLRRRRFVAVERSFGYDAPCQLETDAGPLFVRGKIDKLDRDGSRLLVRDIKTGAGKPRRAADPPALEIDLQLGLYAWVARQLAEQWGTPHEVGVAYLYLRSGEPLRSWIGEDYPQLEAAVKHWLAIAREILATGAFVRSPHPEDCRFCPYQPVCGSEVERAAAVLTDERVPRRLAVLKGDDAT